MNRRKIGKEDEKRFGERLGHASCPRPSGPLVWIHAASVGEAVSVLPLINKIIEKYSKINILLTTGTVTSAKILEERLPNRAFHQYVPIDKVVTVRRFLDHWKPDLALWVESELWPNLIVETHKTGCQMIQLNARLSESSFETWKKARSLAEKMLKCFALSMAQSEEDAMRLEALGAKNVKTIGNLKFDAPALPADPKETGRLLGMIGDRQLWLAVSTHKGEEKIVADVHKKLKEEHPSILTILVPRHPNRTVEIVDILHEIGDLNLAIRSNDEPIEENTDIYIADTVGELGIFFRLANITFMGGSLVEHGGQNPLEAARLECAIISGPHVGSFTEVYKELKQDNAYIEVKDGNELAEIIDKLFNDHEELEALYNRSLEMIESKQGVATSFLNEMSEFFKPLADNEEGENESAEILAE
jgi:3-deoxy-D-manno-octulosonic-acid transferase